VDGCNSEGPFSTVAIKLLPIWGISGFVRFKDLLKVTKRP
jgi:hypothetical protein